MNCQTMPAGGTIGIRVVSNEIVDEPPKYGEFSYLTVPVHRSIIESKEQNPIWFTLHLINRNY